VTMGGTRAVTCNCQIPHRDLLIETTEPRRIASSCRMHRPPPPASVHRATTDGRPAFAVRLRSFSLGGCRIDRRGDRTHPLVRHGQAGQPQAQRGF